MALESNIVGGVSNAKADVVSTGNFLKVQTETNAISNPNNIGNIRATTELDQGFITNSPVLRAFEIDGDYRVRVSTDAILDEEVFNYSAQNTGKHAFNSTTMANSWTNGQMTTNSASITTTTTGTTFSTYAYFPTTGTSTLSADTEVAFTAAPQTNTFVEWGIGQIGTPTTAPTDGVFFRLSSAGLQGIASFNGTETSTGVFPLSAGSGTWVYTTNKRYQFIVYVNTTEAQFWVNDNTGAVLLGQVRLPAANPRLMNSSSAPYFFKASIRGGAAGGVLQALVGAYNVRSGGQGTVDELAKAGNRMFGSYQGFSGGTMGTLANYANSANPTAAVPTNTTAALGTGLGGQFWETVSLAVNTDGIIDSYQVPAGTNNIPGRRLVIYGVGLSSYVQTVVAGGPYNAQYSLAFGHTSVSLATAEAATTKAPRRIALAPFTQLVTAAQAVNTMVTQAGPWVDFSHGPIYVNPGEFVALVAKHVGTAGTTGTVAHQVTFVYGWE